MTEPFRLQTAHAYGCEWIIMPPVDPYGDGDVLRSDVQLSAEGLTARTPVALAATFGEMDLASFFAGLAADRRGWEGKRQWVALEREMMIEASHDRRARVTIAVTLSQPAFVDAALAWSARVVFPVEAGEQLSAVARDLATRLAARP